jgi:hypothetical protein
MRLLLVVLLPLVATLVRVLATSGVLDLLEMRASQNAFLQVG